MIRTIEIDGRPVRFRVSAAVPRIYRVQCGRDIFRDMQAVADAIKESDEQDTPLTAETLTTFENLAYAMAYAAEPNTTPERVEDWLDGFAALPVRMVFPQIELLWLQNLVQLNEPAKK